MSPAVHAPIAAPTPSAVIIQLSPSVSAPEGTSFWTRVNPAMSVGAIATPAKVAAGAMSATLGTKTSGTVPPQSTKTDATKRLSSGDLTGERDHCHVQGPEDRSSGDEGCDQYPQPRCPDGRPLREVSHTGGSWFRTALKSQRKRTDGGEDECAE